MPLVALWVFYLDAFLLLVNPLCSISKPDLDNCWWHVTYLQVLSPSTWFQIQFTASDRDLCVNARAASVRFALGVKRMQAGI